MPSELLQFWLLNLALDHEVPLRCLPPVLDGNPSTSTALNVVSLQGVSFETGVRYLVELAQKGLVEFELSRSGESLASPRVFEYLSHQRRGEEREVSFRLTPAGGREWERMAEPRWQEKSSGSAEWVLAEQWEWTWFSQNRDRLMAELAWYPLIQNENVDFTTVRWDLQDDYPVTYWKRLSNVHVVRFLSREISDLRPAIQATWFREWSSARANWYTKPWKKEGWPPVR